MEPRPLVSGPSCTSCTCICSPRHRALSTNREEPHWRELCSGMDTKWALGSSVAQRPSPANFSHGVITITAASRTSESQHAKNTTSFHRKT